MESSFWASELPTRDSQFPWQQIAPQKGRLLGGGVYIYIIYICYTYYTYTYSYPMYWGESPFYWCSSLSHFHGSFMWGVRLRVAFDEWEETRRWTGGSLGTCVGLCKAKGDARFGKMIGIKNSGPEEMCWFRLEGILFGSQIGTKSDLERVCYWRKCLGTCSR